MLILQTLFLFITWGVSAMVVAAIVLILLRSIFNYANVNPFTWSAITVKRLTDPVIMPVRRTLVGLGIDPMAAPLIAILAIVLVGYFAVQVSGSILNTIAGVIYASLQAPVAIIGYLLYGLLGLYTLAIFMRIACSFFAVSYGNRWMRFLFRATEPLLGPLRRTIPPVGMFDLSPIVAFIIVYLLQAAVVGTLLKGWTVRFF